MWLDVPIRVSGLSHTSKYLLDPQTRQASALQHYFLKILYNESVALWFASYIGSRCYVLPVQSKYAGATAPVASWMSKLMPALQPRLQQSTLGTAPTLQKSIFGVILGAICNYTRNIIQLLQSGGSTRSLHLSIDQTGHENMMRPNNMFS